MDIITRGLKHIGIRKLILIVSLFLIISVNQSTLAVGTGNSVDSSKIDAFINREIERLNIPGASVAIVKGDQIEYLKGYGKSGPDKKMTPQTPIVIGSVSKSFTALAIMQLVDQGKLELTEPVNTYLPGFSLADKDASKEITIQHLLNHTSGLSTYDGQRSIAEGNKSLKEHIESLENIQLVNGVGDTYQYSNLNYDILGLVIEDVANMPYKEYVNNHIFKPLHMNNSYADPRDDVNNTIATGYQTMFGFKVPTEQLNHEGNVPSGYIISSAEDMANYMIAQLNNGQFSGESILSKDRMDEMHHPSSLMWEDTYYAMGWTVNNNVISHDGSTENTYSKVVLDGEYGISLLINSLDYLNVDQYDNIMTGLNNIVQNGEPLISNESNPFTIYIIIDIVILIVLALIAFSTYRIFKQKERKATRIRTIINILSITLINFFIPVIILYFIPKITPWSTVTLFVPGIGHALFIIPILLLLIGVMKVGKMIRNKVKVTSP
ncbi:serine hydrolase domain-containing protein [Lysinibacillus telephonicus]|uniref:serine hydrolase domain-containing protein n=1 Tax=Lysinibacillus telephonicus TaxID=1714840 RepID=UPI0037CD71DC